MAITFCVLGATGKTGSGIVKQLLAKTDANIHIYVRSLAKTPRSLSPISIQTTVSRVFQGSLGDAELLARCVSGASTIFFTLGDNDNRPISVIEDAAKTVLSALKKSSESSEKSTLGEA